MSVTFGSMCQTVLDFIKKGEEASGIVRQAINDEYKRIARQEKWRNLVRVIDVGAALTIGKNYATMPQDCGEIIEIIDTTNKWKFQRKSIENLLTDYPDMLQTSADPLFWATIESPIQQPLSVDDKVKISAENAQDTDIDIVITGLREDPEIEQSETITTDSTTATTVVSGSLTYREGWSMSRISCSEPLSSGGFLKITEFTDTTNVLAYIPKGQKYSRYVVAMFESNVATASSLNIIYKLRVSDLQRDDDVPVIPEAATAIVQGAIAKMRQWDGKYDQAGVHRAESENDISALKADSLGHGPTQFQLRPHTTGRVYRRGF